MTAMPRGGGGRVIFIGAVHEAVPALGVLLDSTAEVVEVITLPPERAATTAGFIDLEPLAARFGVPVRRCADVNSAGSVGRIRALRPDLVVAAGWTRLLSPELLAVPRRGCVGFHASMLPRNRGRAPVNWAILRGETTTGNTLMYLSADADAGDIIDQRPVRIGPGDTCATVYAKVGAAGAAMLRQHLPALLRGTAPRRPQDNGPPGQAMLPKRTPAMGITDWNRPARAVHDWIRALTQPYPGAFTFLGDRKVMLWASAVPPRRPGRPSAGPGQVLGYEAEGVRVGTADGSLLVTAMSDTGEQPEPAADWARRAGVRAGDKFRPVPPATARWALGLGPDPAGGR
ncbi:MAG TPA: methionyl-tRNA formyltransferase [Trebonia sp.]|nr:methionyl-tRNA formyltransferase [Trebonia sp.]